MIDASVDFSDVDMLGDIWWIWHLQTPITLRQVIPLVSRFQDLGFQVISDRSSKPYIEILFYHREDDFYISMSTPSEEDRPFLYLGTFEKPFLPPETARARLLGDQFLEIGKIVYEEIQPTYGFVRNLEVFVEPEDVVNHNLTHLFWAQMLGPNLVDGLGRNLLANAPSWRNENLVGGGLLYVVAVSPYLYKGKRHIWDTTATYFAEHGILVEYRADQSTSTY